MTFVFSILTFILASPSFAGERFRWKVQFVDGEDASCKGFSNGDSCQLICIEGPSSQGRKRHPGDCTKAHNIKTEEQFKALRERVGKVETAMNEDNFQGWSRSQLQDGFTKFSHIMLAPSHSGAGGTNSEQ